MNTWTTAGGTGSYRALEHGTYADKGCGANLSAALSQFALPRNLACADYDSGAQWFRHRIRDLRSNPAFPATAVDFARSTVQLFEGRYLVNKAMANVARQTVCLAILSSYFGQTEKDGGAFLSSIQALTTAMGVCSKNTTASIVALLEKLGLVVRVENHRDRRWQYIQPTQHLIAAVRDFQRISLISADLLFPSRNYLKLFDDNQNVQEACFAVSLYHYMAIHGSVFNQNYSKVFLETDGGTILLLKLLSLNVAGDHTVEFPFEEIGSLYGLSRTHIRRLIRKAEAGGFVRLLQKGGRRVRILPLLEDQFENIVAANIARAQFDIQLATGQDIPA